MFKLESSGVKVNPANPNYTKYIDIFRKKLDRPNIFEVVCDQSFRAVDDPDLAHKLVAWLLIGDEWSRPINQKTASVVFFALCNNIQKNRNVVITNMGQAYTLYNETENDFTKLQSVENDNEHPRFEKLDAYFSFFMKGFLAEFKIPVRFVSVKKKGAKATLRMLDMKVQPEFMFLDGTSSQIAWSKFREFFTGNKFPVGRLGVYDGEKIGSMFNYNLSTAVDVMNYVGFHTDKWLPLGDLLERYSADVQDNKLVFRYSKEARCAVRDMYSYEKPEVARYFRGNTLQPNKDYFVISGPAGVQFYTM